MNSKDISPKMLRGGSTTPTFSGRSTNRTKRPAPLWIWVRSAYRKVRASRLLP